MNNADPLIAAFRQLAIGKAALRPGAQAVAAAKDGKDKAEHFREQLRSVAQGTKPAPKADTERAETDMAQAQELPDRMAEVIEEVTRPKERISAPNDMPSQPATAEMMPSPAEWRGPEAVLSAVISRLDQAQAPSRRDDAETPRLKHVDSRPERPETPLKVDNELKDLKAGDASKPPNADEPPQQRIVLSVDAPETRALPAVKVVVRDQETHFEPVQQVTLLQKIVDRMATDLPAAAPTGPSSPDTALPMPKAPDKPVRILTLQLDPPDLGAVIVKMRLIGDAVEVRLSADRYETTQMLQHERGALTDVMQSAGYSFDIASIDHSRASDANPGASQQQAQPDQRPSQQLHGGSQIDNAASERQSGDTQAGSRQNRRQHDQFTEAAERHQAQEAVPNRSGGAVYL